MYRQTQSPPVNFVVSSGSEQNIGVRGLKEDEERGDMTMGGGKELWVLISRCLGRRPI